MKLIARDISFSYHEAVWLWQHVSLTICGGDMFTILGANGVGKSTLLRTLISYNRPCAGTITLEDGQDVYDSQAETKEFVKRIGYVPQMQNTNYSFALRDYVVMGRAPYLGLFARPTKEDYEFIDEILADIGIYDIKDRPFYTLSGGQQRQAAIARAIAQEPEVIIMDEPTNHLDYGNQFRILALMEHLAEKGMAVLFTTHMPDQALYVGGHTGVLIKGAFIEGKADEILTEERLQEIYQIPIHLLYLGKFQRKICIAG